MKRTAWWSMLCLLIVSLVSTPVWAAEWPKNVSIGTASVGGTFYYAAGAFVKLFEKMGIKATVEVTGGSVHNPKLIQSKQVLFATIAQGSAYEAWTGTGWAKQKYDSLRTVMAIMPAYGHGCALRKKNITNFRDYDGKIVSGGPPGGTSDMYLRSIGALLGIKFARVVTAPYSDTVNLMRDGMIDAIWTSGGVPHGATNEITSTLDGVLVGFSLEDLKKIEAKFPYLDPSAVPANTYKNQTAPLPATADWAALFAHKDVPDDLVYKFCELAFANRDLMVATHKSLADCTLENQKFLSVPLHPGAYKYFKEKGIPIPDKALPPK
jgi:uncharacterized protein